MTAKKQSLLEKGVILHVSDQRHEVSGLSLNRRTMGGFSFCPFSFIFPFFLFSLMVSLSQKLQEQTDDSSLSVFASSQSFPFPDFFPRETGKTPHLKKTKNLYLQTWMKVHGVHWV